MPVESATYELNEVEVRLAYAQAARVLIASPIERGRHATTTAPSVSQRGKVVAAGIKFLSPLLRELEELRTITPERDDYGVLRATSFAYNAASELLINAAIVAALAGRQIPRGLVNTDSEGGIRIEWNRPHKSVRLAIPAGQERDGYVYHEVGGQYLTESVTAEVLAQRLDGID